jgi:hypothetical protein
LNFAVAFVVLIGHDARAWPAYQLFQFLLAVEALLPNLALSHSQPGERPIVLRLGAPIVVELAPIACQKCSRDSFLNLSPERQNATIDEISRSLGSGSASPVAQQWGQRDKPTSCECDSQVVMSVTRASGTARSQAVGPSLISLNNSRHSHRGAENPAR